MPNRPVGLAKASRLTSARCKQPGIHPAHGDGYDIPRRVLIAQGKRSAYEYAACAETCRKMQLARKVGGRWNARMAELSFARELIAPDILEGEPGLGHTTWLSYRHMRAYERTVLFSTEHAKASIRLHAKYKDNSSAASKPPIVSACAYNLRGEVTSLWNARQLADARGVPH